MFKKLLIANRGEIAVRIVRACRDLDISPVAVFSDVDRRGLHVQLADEAYHIGAAPSRESYLRIDTIIETAVRSGCDSLHPGYGFLAENPELARACSKADITFVGPSAEAMERLGSKTAARQLAYTVGIPMVAGVREAIQDIAQAERIANEIGYPVLLKAVAGGGGKGMRSVAKPSDLPAAWRDARSEALNAFGDEQLYLEKYLEHPRHIEIQFFGDAQGNFVYLGERECSVQRRHQKVVEEAPSAFVTSELRQKMGEAAIGLAKAAGYTNAGTAEFLVDAQGNFFFLEVNTRLQVEHPVTEVVTCLDLVKLQLLVASGAPLPLTQQDVALRGHAIECRIYAEDPETFFPSPGAITRWNPPSGPGVRLDAGAYSQWTVPGDYDPLLAKLIVSGADRSEAISRLRRALAEFYVGGIKTNIALFAEIALDPDFVSGSIYTRWLDDWLVARKARQADVAPAGKSISAAREDAVTIAALISHLSHSDNSSQNGEPAPQSRWKSEGRREQLDRGPERSL